MLLHKNKIIIAAAGSGKTTRIVEQSIKSKKKSVIVTYTRKNEAEIKKKFYDLNGSIPNHVMVVTWFRFLLNGWIRPYRNFIYDHRIEGINFVQSHSTQKNRISKSQIRYYITRDHKIHSDKIAEFALKCNDESNGMVLDRLQSLYEHVYIDEVQDLAGYDLELLETLLQSIFDVTLIGDYRQVTYLTNRSPKNKKYRGRKIIDKFQEWSKKELCSLQEMTESYRCNQIICDFADQIYPDAPQTTSRNTTRTEHDGIYLVAMQDVDSYINQYAPQILRYNRKTDCKGYEAINYGDSKGLTFDRILVFPYGGLKKLLKSGDYAEVQGSAARVYVAVTRAKYSVAFVYDGSSPLPTVKTWTHKE
ncbi:MAG: AAA family ATPase [Chloroflexota bacterium]